MQTFAAVLFLVFFFGLFFLCGFLLSANRALRSEVATYRSMLSNLRPDVQHPMDSGQTLADLLEADLKAVKD